MSSRNLNFWEKTHLGKPQYLAETLSWKTSIFGRHIWDLNVWGGTKWLDKLQYLQEIKMSVRIYLEKPQYLGET